MLLKELRALVASFLGLGRLHRLSFSCGMSCLPPWRSQCWYSWNTTSSWDLNQASCSWPPSGGLTSHLQACAGGLGQIVPDPAFLFVVFYPQNDWRKWVNSAFRKTPLFKNCRCERLSLLYISKIEIYNPLSALLLTLVCHFYYVLLRVAIFVLNVAIGTYFERRQKELSTKTLLWKFTGAKLSNFLPHQPLGLLGFLINNNNNNAQNLRVVYFFFVIQCWQSNAIAKLRQVRSVTNSKTNVKEHVPAQKIVLTQS